MPTELKYYGRCGGDQDTTQSKYTPTTLCVTVAGMCNSVGCYVIWTLLSRAPSICCQAYEPLSYVAGSCNPSRATEAVFNSSYLSRTPYSKGILCQQGTTPGMVAPCYAMKHKRWNPYVLHAVRKAVPSMTKLQAVAHALRMRRHGWQSQMRRHLSSPPESKYLPEGSKANALTGWPCELSGRLTEAPNLCHNNHRFKPSICEFIIFSHQAHMNVS